MIQTIQITCEGTHPLILHRYTLAELLSMWGGAVSLRHECEAIPYYDDDDRLVVPRPILQAVLTRAAHTIGLELTPKRRLVPGMRLAQKSYPLVRRDKQPARLEVSARTGNGARVFSRLESITCVLPRFDHWRFDVEIELGEAMDWRVARRIWDMAGRLGIGDNAPRLGQFVIQHWSWKTQSKRRTLRERMSR